jgi:excisionase family DNA binding protein
MSDEIPKLLTLLELAERLRVSPHTVRAWIRQGRLQPVRLCRRLLFSPTEILRLLGASEEANEKTADCESAANKEVRHDHASPRT